MRYACTLCCKSKYFCVYELSLAFMLYLLVFIPPPTLLKNLPHMFSVSRTLLFFVSTLEKNRFVSHFT